VSDASAASYIQGDLGIYHPQPPFKPSLGPLPSGFCEAASDTPQQWRQRLIAPSCISRCWTMYVWHSPFAFLLSFLFSCGTLLQYLVYLVLIVIIFFRLINHENRMKITAFIHHISLATFAQVAGDSTPILFVLVPIFIHFFVVHLYRWAVNSLKR
jgi:hypothetical protein